MKGATAIVFLVRHGRTALNAQGALRGHIDIALDDIGRVEAEALASTFAGCAISTVVTSPLARARQTAGPIAAATGARIEIDRALIDRDYGPWAGHPAVDVVDRFGSLDDAPGVESAAHLCRRAVAATEAAAELADGGPVVVVAHDAVNRSVLASLVPTLRMVGQRTGCWNRLERTPDGWVAPIIDAPGERR